MDEEEFGWFDREIAGCHFADERLKGKRSGFPLLSLKILLAMVARRRFC